MKSVKTTKKEKRQRKVQKKSQRKLLKKKQRKL